MPQYPPGTWMTSLWHEQAVTTELLSHAPLPTPSGSVFQANPRLQPNCSPISKGNKPPNQQPASSPAPPSPQTSRATTFPQICSSVLPWPRSTHSTISTSRLAAGSQILASPSPNHRFSLPPSLPLRPVFQAEQGWELLRQHVT